MLLPVTSLVSGALGLVGLSKRVLGFPLLRAVKGKKFFAYKLFPRSAKDKKNYAVIGVRLKRKKHPRWSE
jgi:hypothetical protein